MANSTFRFRPTPSAMLVAVPDDLAARCAATLEPLRMIRVAHAAAACERMAVTLPRVVVVVDTLLPNDRTMLEERAIACGAQLVFVSAGADPEALDVILREAAATSAKKRGSR
jgi:hypothetical protein